MILIALAFLAGHCLLHLQPRLPTGSPWVQLSCVFLLFVFVVGLAKTNRWPRVRGLLAVGLAFALGFGHAAWHARLRLSDQWPDSRSGTDVDLRGRIESFVETREGATRFRMAVLDGAVSDADASLPRHVELTWYDAIALPQPGECWQLRVRLRSPRGFANPGGYDYEGQMLRDDIGASGYVRAATGNRKLEAASGYWTLRVRSAIATRIESTLPHSPMIGIIQGLTVGATSRMTPDQWRVLANTGTTHLMAISGMHIAMVALAVAWFAGSVARRLHLQPTRVSIVGVQALVGIAAAACYSALAGFSIPTQRTFVMLTVFLCARSLRRVLPLARGFSLALIAVLLLDPFAPLASGFWLSFGAVAAIFLATEGSVLQDSRTRQYLKMQIVVTIGLTPLIIAAFGNISLIAPLVNLIAIPFFTLLIVPLVLIGSALLFLSGALGSAILIGAEFLLATGWPLLEWAGHLPLALVSLPNPSAWALAMLVVGAFVLVAPGNLATRCAGFLMCLPAMLWQPPRPKSGEFELTVLDVGQGLSIVVTTSQHVLVYDTGPRFRSGRDVGELVIVPFLRARGVRKIDTVIVSHGDEDHVGGLESVRALEPTGELLLGPSVEPRAASEQCAAGQRWDWDGVSFEMLYPSSETASMRRNETSCVLRIEAPGGSAVLLGDIERTAERWLATHDALRHADVAVVPHHGSNTSSSTALVSALSSRYALISAGFGNQWGFPKSDVVDRWREAGAAILKTEDSGAIAIEFSASGIGPPHAYRAANRRYWRK